MTLNDLPEIEIKRNIRSTRLRLRVDAHRIRLTAPIFCTKRQIRQNRPHSARQKGGTESRPGKTAGTEDTTRGSGYRGFTEGLRSGTHLLR